jgi:predicted aminopeptidase
VQAYSTLNWFNDPVLNTFLQQDDIRLASLLFHEMAHQVLYIPDDSLFNESFAKTVEMEGLRRWFNHHGTPDLWKECQRREKRSMEFQVFLADVRAQLNEVYQSGLANDQKRIRKNAIISHAYEDYERLKTRWDNDSGYDEWIYAGLNNARLSSVGTYFDYVPAFQELLRSVSYDLKEFYVQVKAIAGMPEVERTLKMSSLSPVLKTSLQPVE